MHCCAPTMQSYAKTRPPFIRGQYEPMEICTRMTDGGWRISIAFVALSFHLGSRSPSLDVQRS